jgi:hypothetical protein
VELPPLITTHLDHLKSLGHYTKKDARHFSVLDKLGMPQGPGSVLCLTESTMPITKTVWAVPVSEI